MQFKQKTPQSKRSLKDNGSFNLSPNKVLCTHLHPTTQETFGNGPPSSPTKSRLFLKTSSSRPSNSKKGTVYCFLPTPYCFHSKTSHTKKQYVRGSERLRGSDPVRSNPRRLIQITRKLISFPTGALLSLNSLYAPTRVSFVGHRNHKCITSQF